MKTALIFGSSGLIVAQNDFQQTIFESN